VLESLLRGPASFGVRYQQHVDEILRCVRNIIKAAIGEGKIALYDIGQKLLGLLTLSERRDAAQHDVQDDYCAPEIIQHYHTGMGYGREVDMWSLGVILYIMLSGIAPFGQGQQAKQLLTDIIQGNFSFPDRRFNDVSDTAKDLINMLLVPDPKTRWTAEQALEHEWLKGENIPKGNPSS
jgi:serine/threonine protein kinase